MTCWVPLILVTLLRALDTEMKVQCKGKDPNFDFRKLSFVAELAGQEQESHIESAQSRVTNARRCSLEAGFRLFKTNVKNDQIIHDRHRSAVDTNAARNRSAMIHSLEDSVLSIRVKMISFCHKLCQLRTVFWVNILWSMSLQKMHHTAWDLVNTFAGESIPTWNVAAKKNVQGRNLFRFSISLPWMLQ